MKTSAFSYGGITITETFRILETEFKLEDKWEF